MQLVARNVHSFCEINTSSASQKLICISPQQYNGELKTVPYEALQYFFFVVSSSSWHIFATHFIENANMIPRSVHCPLNIRFDFEESVPTWTFENILLSPEFILVGCKQNEFNEELKPSR